MSNQVVQGQQSQYRSQFFSFGGTSTGAGLLPATFVAEISNLNPVVTPYKSTIKISIATLTVLVLVGPTSLSFTWAAVIPAQLRPAVASASVSSVIRSNAAFEAITTVFPNGDIVLAVPEEAAWDFGPTGYFPGVIASYFI